MKDMFAFYKDLFNIVGLILIIVLAIVVVVKRDSLFKAVKAMLVWGKSILKRFVEDRELTKLEMRCGAAGVLIGFFIALWPGYNVGTIINNWLGVKYIILRGFVNILAIGVVGNATSGILWLIGCNIGYIFVKNKKPED